MSNPIVFSNDAQSTLSGSITNVATTANLSAGTGALFPHPAAGQYFVGTFIDQATGLLKEIVHVTDVTGDVITMERAQEGTTALNWLAGDIFAHFMTAGQAAAFRQSGVPLDLASNADVTGVLPLGNLPASDTTGGLPVMVLHAGDPNGAVAGNANVNGASDFCYDTTNKVLYVCTTTGNAAGAVWTASVTVGVTFIGGTSGGTAANQTLAALTPTGFSLTANMAITFIPGFSSTGVTTLNAVATGGKTIKKIVGGSAVDLAANDLLIGQPATVIYNGTVYILLNPAMGTAAAKTASMAASNTLVSANGAITSGHLPSFADTAGTVQDSGLSSLLVPKVWCVLNGSATTITNSQNVSSVSKNTTADYMVNLATAVASVGATVAGADYNAGTYPQVWGSFWTSNSQIRVRAGNTANGVTADMTAVNVVGYGS